MHAVPFTPDDSDRWDELVEYAPMSTFLHSRRFLSYHGDRFEDASLLLVDDGDVLRAVLPAALDSDDRTRVISHAGATFGGLVHGGRLAAEDTADALAAAATHYAERSFAALVYKPVPHIYHRSPSAEDVWALCLLGATRVRCALSVAIDLAARRRPSAGRADSLRKARHAGLAVSEDARLEDIWPLLEHTLARRYAAAPVHSLADIKLLRDRFPDVIRPLAATLDGEIVGAVVLFLSPRVTHVQYMASSERGMEVGAVDAVIERCIELAASDPGVRYFDFGTSMADGGALQSSLHRFKAGFGGGGVVYEQYELGLTADDRR